MPNDAPDASSINVQPRGFDEIDCWVFDLDNTLYPVTKRLLEHIDRHMGGFVAKFLGVDADEAHRIQKQYFREYGLTLRGLMIHHDLDPAQYYDEMTPMDLDEVDPNPALARSIANLPGRKVIYTNASANHAELVLERLGMAGLFEAIYDIEAANWVPKPAIESYRLLCERHDIDPIRAVMIDDIARNLEPAAKLGMMTVWMKTSAEWARDTKAEAHIHHLTGDLKSWVDDIANNLAKDLSCA
jgi:putative hydrolase of the HAD superfamily